MERASGMIKQINRWQVHGFFGRCPYTMERFAKRVEFGILNIHTMPEQGEALWKAHYKGFIIKFYIWLPIDW